MASILDRYGIKEVADVTFYKINSDGTRGDPVLYLDTLKVSTIEQTAETVDARGGKGNPKLVTWDYGKEISVSIEDALFSSKSMAIMFGDGTVTKEANKTIYKTATIRLSSTGLLPEYFTADIYDANMGSARKKVYMGGSTTPSGMVAFADSGITLIASIAEDGTSLDANLTAQEWATAAGTATAPYSSRGGEKVFITYSVSATAKTITISGDTFPGTYYIQGDTYARSDVDGKDQFFQFIIPKAKMTAENTITLEAEGDPSVFNMNLTVLRPEDGEMMKLVQYDLASV